MNPLLQVDEREIENLDQYQFADILNRLLKAEAQRHGIPLQCVETTLRINDPDGGVDARVEHSIGVPPECRIPPGLSVWQYKAGSIGPADIQRESQKPGVQAAIDAGGSYRFVLGRGYAGTPKRNREEAVNECYILRGLAPKGQLLMAQDVADWVADYPAVAMHPYFRRPLDDRLLIFEEWGNLPELRTGLEFEADAMRESVIEQLRQVASDRANLNRAMIAGYAGVGKTRLAFEAVRTCGLQHEALYACSPDDIPPTLLSWIAGRPSLRVTLVVDECTYEEALRLHGLAQRCGDRLVLILVGQEREPRGTSSQIPLFWLGRLDDQAVGRIVQRVSSTLPRDAVDFVVRGSGGYVRLAVAMAESLAGNPSMAGAAQLTGVPDVKVILESLVSDAKDHSAMMALSLLRRVGLDDDVSQEGRAVASFMRLDLGQLKLTASRMKQAGLVVRRGRYAYVTPHLLAVWFAAEVWQARADDIVRELLPPEGHAPRTPAFIEALLERLADLGEEDVTGPIVGRLLSPEGLFATIRGLDGSFSSRLFAALGTAAPRVSAAVLERLLGRLPRDSLLEFREGRRNLVSLLEGLLSFEETFWTAARLLLRLAEAENEAFANNASGTWCEIFYTYLGGTPVPAVERHRLIAEALDSASVQVRLLGVRAIAVALSTHETRLRSTPVGGHISPPHWHPQTWEDVRQVRHSALGLLDRALLDEDDHVASHAREVLINASRAMIKQGLAADILPRLKSLPLVTEADQRRIWELLRDTLYFEHEALSEDERAYIQQWAGELMGDAYHDRLRRWVGPLATSDYKQLRDSNRTQRDVAAELAEEGFANPEALRAEAAWLASSDPTEFFAFGRRLGQLDSGHNWLDDLVNEIRQGGNPGFLTAYLQGRVDAGEANWVEGLLDGWSRAEPELAPATLDAIWRLEGHDRGAARVLSMLDKGWLQPAQLGLLAYGGWVKPISAAALVPILQRFAQDPSSAATEANLLLLLHWLETHPQETALVEEYAWPLLERPCALTSRGMFLFYWKGVAEFYLPTSAPRLARAILTPFDAGDFIAIPSDERLQLLQAALVQDPERVWPMVGEVLLRDDRGSHRLRLGMQGWGAGGLCTDLLTSWAENHAPRGTHILADLAPVQGNPLAPLARELLVRFGHDERIGATLRGHYLSGSWVGSEAQWLKTKLAAARNWLQDDHPAVRTWAAGLVAKIELAIPEIERQEEEEELL